MRQYRKSRKLFPCKLKENDLPKLIEIIKEGSPELKREGLRIHSNLPDVLIEANDINDFVKHPELPDRINRLSVDFTGWNQNGGINEFISLTLYDNFGELTVSGSDQTWVLGKYAQIIEFLKKRRPWFHPIRRFFPFIAGIVPVWVFGAIIDLMRAQLIVYAISLTIFLVTWMVVVLYYFKDKFLPHTEIVIRPKRSILNKETIVVIIAALSLAVSIIGVIISWIK